MGHAHCRRWAGGGIAAIHLAEGGHRVLLIDKKRYPRDKACGDGLLGDAIQCLQRVGLYESIREIGNEIHAASIFSPSRVEIEVESTCFCLERVYTVAQNECLTLRRRYLDALIVLSAIPLKTAMNTYFVGYSIIFEKFLLRKASKLARLIPIDAVHNLIEAMHACSYVLRRCLPPELWLWPCVPP